jgi:uncharacterized protein
LQIQKTLKMPKSISKQVQNIKCAADDGDPKSQAILGILYFHGKGVGKNYKESLRWFRKALKNKKTWAKPIERRVIYEYLGYHYYFGFGVQRHFKKAFMFDISAAQAGSKQAQLVVGDMYSEGTGAKRNLWKAFEYYMMAATAGDAQGQFEVGRAYLDGIGVKHDQRQGMYWMQKAADAGIADAQAMVGLACFEAGDRKKAVKLLSESADKGSCEGLYGLASL